jgi:hypothetical protein
LIQFQKGNISDWITAIGQQGSKRQQRVNAGIVFFFWWYIGKEPNKRIFESKESSFIQTAEHIKEAFATFSRVYPTV